MKNSTKITTLTAVLFTLCLPILPSRAAQPLPPLQISAGFGVNIHFTGNPKDLDMIARAGFKFIRMDLTWAAVERQKGVYNFAETGYDALTAGCAQRGIRILYILDYSNPLYETNRSVRTEPGRIAFAAFAQAAAQHYKNRGIVWEIWNEPNLKHFWSPQPGVEDYCKLVELAAERIKKTDPTGLVVAPAASGIPLEWLEKCFQNGLLQWIDALSLHPYRSQPPETVIKDYKKLRQLIKRYAPDKSIPIISGEWGYSNVNWNKKPLSDQTQGRYLVRMFLTNIYQNIPISIWYDWKNDGINPKEREHNFGTVTNHLKPKTAYLAAKTLTDTLNGFTIKKRLQPGNNRDFILSLAKNNLRALALWTLDSEHQVKLNLAPGQAVLVDMLGKKQDISWNTKQLNLKISPNPQYLLIKD